jgi:hypothetical protein
MRPARAFQRILEHMQDLILDQRLNALEISVCLRVVCGRVPAWARAALERGLETAEIGRNVGNEARRGF